MDSVVLVLFGAIFLYLVVKLLNLASQAAPPALYFKESESKFIREILRDVPLLTEPYVPPLIWGKCGHLQTIVYGKLGRVNSPFPKGKREMVVMDDGSTLTFDVFEPHYDHVTGGDYTMAVCPGIANSSESVYIRTFVDYAQNHGYRVIVLNHLGALKHVPLTAPRIFTYGGTEEYGTMVDYIRETYPDSSLISVGFSMGANIVLKYLGEDSRHQEGFLCGISICQGYCVNEVEPLLMEWTHMRRAYILAMTLHQKGLLKHHRDVLFSPDAVERYGVDYNMIMSATSLVELDEFYGRRRAEIPTIYEFYEQNSCKDHLQKINIPVFVLNSEDDPLVPTELLHIPKKFVMSKDNCLLAVTTHGGHLGFFEGDLWAVNQVTWLDKIVVQYADAMTKRSQKQTFLNEEHTSMV